MKRRAILGAIATLFAPAQALPGPMPHPQVCGLLRRGELGRIDGGLRIIGVDLARGPDLTVCATRLPDGGWVSIHHPDARIEWERALRGI